MRRRPLYEVVGQLGMWGVIINGIQASIIEHNKMKEVTWSGRNSMYLYPRIEFSSNARTPSWAVVWLHNRYVYCDYFDCNTLTSPHSNVYLVYRRAFALSSRLLRLFQLEPTLQ